MAKRHVAALKKVKRCCPMAVFSHSKKQASQFGRSFGLKPFHDYQKLLNDSEIDVVDIVTISSKHAQLGTLAACSGKHIIVEKPLSLSVHEGEKLIKTCKENKVSLAIILQNRFRPSIAAVREKIIQGHIGKVFQVGVSYHWPRTKNNFESRPWIKNKGLSGGGTLFQQGIHFIDLLLWFFGPIYSVIGTSKNVRGFSDLEDTVIGVLNFKSGLCAVIQGSLAVKRHISDRMEFHGTEGSLFLAGDKMSYHQPSGVCLFTKTEKYLRRWRNHSVIRPLKDQLQHITDCVLSSRSPSVNGEEAIRSLHVIKGLYYSFRSGKEIVLSRDI
jgi:predicted dehydrogenase